MNPIRFFEKQIEKWNEDNLCDQCYFFSAPLKREAINLQQIREEHKCCVQVMLTDLISNCIKDYNTTTGLLVNRINEYSFNLYILIPSKLGMNNFNEIKGHDEDESKWSKILEPLLECFLCSDVLDCEILGYPIEVPRWQMNSELNLQNNNYDGWRISATFRFRNLN